MHKHHMLITTCSILFLNCDLVVHHCPAVAQSVGAWAGSRRVTGSSPPTRPKYGMWTATWRGPPSTRLLVLDSWH